jgi:hypothetical protein
VGKLLMIAGGVLLAAGAFLHLAGNAPPLFNLPGDIKIERENFTFSFPIVSCVVLSVALSVIFNLFNRG